MSATLGGTSAGGTFVGRGRELDALVARLRVDVHPSGGVVLVSGPAGVGKSTLVEHAVGQFATVPVVRGYCPAEPTPPLWVWRAALRRAGAEIVTGVPMSVVEPQAVASIGFAALARMSDAVLAAGPMVIVLEDLQWADAASLDLLQQMARAAADAGITIIGTVRSPAPEDVAVALAGLARYGAMTVVVPPFTAAEVAELVEPGLAADVFARTGGLPLLVAAVRAGYASADLPTVVRTLLASLAPAERDVIEMAAVAGEEVDEDLLAALFDGAEHTVADALTAAWHGGLLGAADAGRTYRFAHALIRDGILARLEPSARRRLNRSIALALESIGADGPARIAAHWRQAGTDPETRRTAARWSRRAAVQAQAAHAYQDAVRFLVDATAGMSSPDGNRAEVLLELAHAEYLAGQYDRCLDHCVDAADAADATGRDDLVARSALVLHGVTYPEAGAVVTRLCRRALAKPDLTDALRARLLAQVAVMAADAGRVIEAVAPARESLRLAAASGDPDAELDSARAREMTLVLPSDCEERLRLGDLVADHAEALGRPLAAIMGHGWRMQAGFLAARIDVVDSATTAVERLAKRSPAPLAQWHMHRMAASRAVLTGRFGESAEHSRRATEIALASGDVTAIEMHFAYAHFVASLRGDPAGLPSGNADALAATPSLPLVDIARAKTFALLGSQREAREVYDRLRGLLPIAYDHPAWAAVLVDMVPLIEQFDDAETAETAYRQLLSFRPYPGALGSPTVYFTGTVSRYLGQLAAVVGDNAGAAELLREALVRNRALGARPDTALTCLSLARLLRSGGGAPTEAAQYAQEALDLAIRLDMPGTVTAAGRLAAEIAADRDEADPLTAREREVAGLVSDGLTNRQIAARLVLSERTIESHVRSILAKTQCANRTEFRSRGSHGKLR